MDRPPWWVPAGAGGDGVDSEGEDGGGVRSGGGVGARTGVVVHRQGWFGVAGEAVAVDEVRLVVATTT